MEAGRIEHARPVLAGVLETALYHGSGEAVTMRAFYSGVLGLREVGRWRDGACFRVGDGVLLLFDRDQTASRADEGARHGASGRAHVCFVADAGRYDAWHGHLTAAEVSFEETTWQSGARSLFFRDPALNLLEVAERDLWPRA